MFAPLEHEEDGTQNLVSDSDDGAFVTTSDHDRLELQLEHRGGATGRMGEFAAQTPHVKTATWPRPIGLVLPKQGSTN